MATDITQDDIFKAVSTLRASPNLDDRAIYNVLVNDGMGRQLAARLVEFAPIVYARLILRSHGARFSNTFRRALPEGSYREQFFSSDPLWNALMAFAHSEVARGVSSQDLLTVAARSAEFDAANQLLNQGSKLQNLVFTSPVLSWPESGPDAES